MPKWVINITLPEQDGNEGTAIGQERLTEEMHEFCQAGFDLEPDEYTLEVLQAPAAEAEAKRTGTEG